MLSDIQRALQPLKEDAKNTGVFSDLDGTLSRIVDTPTDAVIEPEMRSVLQELSKKYGVVGIVSGRNSEDVMRIVGLDDIVYIGNHGLEWIEGQTQYYYSAALEYLELASKLAEELGDTFKDIDILVEGKKLGVSLHYRLSKDIEEARRLIERAVSPVVEEYGLRILEGRYVVELKPDLPVNKGDAVKAVALSKGIRNALYLGDDVTDIDAFKVLDDLDREGLLRAVSVAAQADEASDEVVKEADYAVDSVGAVGSLLRWMAE